MLDVIEPLVKEFGHGVDLRAVTCAEDNRFSNTVESNEAGDRFCNTLCIKSNAFKEVKRGGAVVNTDDKDRHVAEDLRRCVDRAVAVHSAKLRRCSEASLFVVRDDLQFNGKVYSSNADAERHVNHHGCEVKNARDPAFYESISGILGG